MEDALETGRPESLHEPVLLEEVVSYLAVKPGDTVLDGTVGSGGHAEALLKLAGPSGRLIGLDRDEEALERSRRRLSRIGARFDLVQSNFLFLDEALESLNIRQVHAVLLDVGFSRDQVEDPARGFSFLREGPLDMRMDRQTGKSAAELIQESTERKLELIFRTYGEEWRSRQFARAIVKSREEKPIETTLELAEVIKKHSPPAMRYGRIHPATRVFQALRIAVNGELEALEGALPKAFSALASGGRLGVISFHSLEDRLVKRFFVGLKKENRGAIVTKKPVQPTSEEISRNKMARSAKLRVIEKI